MTEKIINVQEYISPEKNWDVIKRQYDSLVASKAYETLESLYAMHHREVKTPTKSNNDHPKIHVQSPAGIQVKSYGERQVSKDGEYKPLFDGEYENSGVNVLKYIWKFDYTTGKRIHQGDNTLYEAYRIIQAEVDQGSNIRLLSKEKKLFTRQNAITIHGATHHWYENWYSALEEGECPIQKKYTL